MKAFLEGGVLLTAVFLISLIGGCASTDPREGGLIGGIQGISTGEYEERVREREERLQRLKEIQNDLDREGAALEDEKERKTVHIEDQQRQVEELHKKTEALAADIDQFEAGLRDEVAKQEDLRERLSQLQKKIDTLREKSTEEIEIEQLEAERAALEREYRLLLDLYRELSQ